MDISIGYAYPTSCIAKKHNKGAGMWYVKKGSKYEKEQNRSSAIDSAIALIEQGHSLLPLQKNCWKFLKKLQIIEAESITDVELLEKCRYSDGV